MPAIEMVLERQTVGTFPIHGAANHAVAHLAKRDSPVGHTAIVGTDLHLVEAVLGQITRGRATLAGAATGADHEFLSRSPVVAARYDVVADAEVAEDAKDLLIKIEGRSGSRLGSKSARFRRPSHH